MKKSLITIFTPTYNRASYLVKLFESLKKQTNRNFCWLIVDDGSSDNTEEIVQTFVNENVFKITYYKQINQGKHIAINQGLSLANSDYFFIVDSDDYLTSNAIEVINKYLSRIESKEFCGLVFNRIYSDGQIIGGINQYSEIESSLYDLKFKYKLNSDKAEIFKTDILKQYLFPKFDTEKFSPEALVMFRMSGPYKILYINQGIYVTEYLEGGLTFGITKVRMKSPKASCLYYSEHFIRAHSLSLKIKSAVNFYRFQANDSSIKNEIPFPFSLLKPLGIIMYNRDKKKVQS